MAGQGGAAPTSPMLRGGGGGSTPVVSTEEAEVATLMPQLYGLAGVAATEVRVVRIGIVDIGERRDLLSWGLAIAHHLDGEKA